jgi:dodecin
VSDSVYRVTELIGVSTESWEAATRNAIETAARTLRDLRIAEAHRFDVTIENGTVKSYRVRLDVSFRYDPDVSGSRTDQTEEWEHTRHELQW